MHALKLRAVGSSTGMTLPKELLAQLHAKQGQEVYAVEVPKGFLITTLNPEVKTQVETGEAFMEQYKAAFAILAK